MQTHQAVEDFAQLTETPPETMTLRDPDLLVTRSQPTARYHRTDGLEAPHWLGSGKKEWPRSCLPL